MATESFGMRRKHSSWDNESSSQPVLSEPRNSHGRQLTWDASSGRAQPLNHPAWLRDAQKPTKQSIQFDLSNNASRLPYSSSQNNSIDVRNDMNSADDGSDHSVSSSETSESCTSSSYTSRSCESLTDIDDWRGSAEHRTRVKFKSPSQENDTKFDEVIRRVESVLYKPCELFILNRSLF